MSRRLNAKEVLQALRDEASQEYGIRGIGSIGEWFFKVGFAKRPVSRRQLYRWKSDHGCPFGSPRPGHGAWTTNLLLMSWAANRVRLSTKLRPKDRRIYKPRNVGTVAEREMVAEAIRAKLRRQAAAQGREALDTLPIQPPSA